MPELPIEYVFPQHIQPTEMPQGIQKSLRYRVNISISVKGVKTWECTTDGEGYTMEEVLERSERLVKALETRYPAPSAEEK